MDTTQEPSPNDDYSHSYHQINLWDLPGHNWGPADRFGLVGIPPYHCSQDAGGPLVAPGTQWIPTSPIPGPFATHAENSSFLPEEYTGATRGFLSVVPDPPDWPTLRRPIDMARGSCNNFRPPCIPEVEYGPMEYRWSYIDRLGPVLVESAPPQAVGSDTHPGSGGVLHAPGSKLLHGDANTIGPYDDTWVPFARPPPTAGQATSCQPSGGIGARVGIHPPGHAPERGKYVIHRVGERGGEVALSDDGEMNRAEQGTMSSTSGRPDQCFEATPSLDRNEDTSTTCTPIEAGVGTCRDSTVVCHTPASLPSSSAYTSTFPGPVSPRVVGAIRTVQPSRRASHRYEGSVFDRPGKKVAAEHESDPVILRERCRQRGGKDFAVAWMSKIFVDGVTVDALMRPLTMLEVDAMILRRPEFKPAQGYDGFLEKHNERFECGLCPGQKKMHWKNKKDAVAHLRKFHFGLADRRIDCDKLVYSVGEMTSHRCRKECTSKERVQTVESNHLDLHLA